MSSKTSGFSPTRLARMHATLLRHVDSGRLPGLVALMGRRGAEHVDAIGTLAFDRTAPMRRDTMFRLASVTKPITAVAAMILVEECKLRLDDPVDEFLPELANRKLSESRAEAVKRALVSRAVEPSRIDARGYGPAFPIASNETPTGRQLNRRVEIVINPS